MSKSVLLDTCFLICLVDDTRENHNKAVDFYQYFIENGISMCLVSIVTSEFSIKQSVKDLPLNNFKLFSYGIRDADSTSALYDALMNNRGGEACRNCIKDDYKILGFAETNNVDYIITEDTRYYAKLQNLKAERSINVQPIFLPDGHQAFFRVQGQLF